MDDFIDLSVGGVVYEGPRTMVQFEVQKTRMLRRGPQYLVVEITLKRIFQYHLAATYLPSALLMILTTITFFVDEKHFDVTIMVHLTTMLVTYTLYDGVSASMPKTSYLKFIDIWLLYGLIVPFMTFVVEVTLRLLSVDDDEVSLKENVIRVNQVQSQMDLTMISQSPNPPEEQRNSISLRKRAKTYLHYAGQVMIPLVSIVFIGSYTYVAYTYSTK